MRAYAGIFVIIGLLLIVGTAGAAGVPDTVTVSTDKSWLIANNLDQSTITVTVTNTTLGAVQGAAVTLALNDTIYGTLSPQVVTTDISGTATSTFKVKTKSGAAQITATASGISGSTIQHIDHGSPYFPYFAHPLNGTVATQVPFNISITDRWGNRIDSLKPNETHSVSLHVNGPSSDCNFVGYGRDLLNQPLDPNGNLSLAVKLTTKKGNNYILMDSFGSISDKVETIEAVATGIPYSMTGKISDGGILPANNQAYFIIDYFLYDIYGNSLNNRTIWVNTTLEGPEEQVLKTSNSLGQIQLKYGPKVSVNNITITAISIDNHSVTNVLHAEFINSGATNMVLAINPQTMPSREIPTYQPAQVIGKVTDFVGNPVAGEIVTFEIQPPFTKTPSNVTVTGDPSFSTSSVVTKINATTNADGNAIAYFYPGSFTIQQNDPNYSDKAGGSCYVAATWNSQPSQNPPVKLEWKNYPYLSVTVNATPQTVKVNDTVDVVIRVTGDGYMMLSRPITVMLDMDASSSLNSGSRGPDAKDSSKKFVDNMSTSQDQVGLVSYGDEDNDVFHSNASYNFIQVKAAIDNLTLHGGVTGGNAITVKESIDEAVYRIMHNPTLHPQEVRAIISLGDSAYDSGELPALVKETWGSDGNEIRVFTIMFLSSSGGCGSLTDSKLIRMRELAEQAGGKYYCGSDPAAIDAAYADIAQTLRMLAGVNASMDLSFQNVEVNSTPMSGGLVFDYVPETKTTWPNATVTYKNQSSEWTSPNYQLHFDIGTIHVGEVWQTEYRLKVKETGLIKLFGPGSKISFNNGTGELNLPEVFITSIPNATPLGSQSGTLDVSNLAVTKSGNITDYVPLRWNMKYTGFAIATEKIFYSYNNGPWVPIDAITGIAPGDYIHTAQLDVKKFPQGSYQIRVQAVAPDSPDAEDITALFNIGGRTISIKLE
jgi:hypothetical protein